MNTTAFKNTDIGPIPEDWEVKTLELLIQQKIATIQTGPFGTVLKAEMYSDVGVPVISVREIRTGYIQLVDETPMVSVDVFKKLSQYALEESDLVFARKGEVNRSALIPNDEQDYFLGSDGIRVRFHGSDPMKQFVLYYCQGETAKNYLIQNSFGSTMSGLNETILKHLPILFPSFPEQRRIAAALSDADELVASLDKLIEKKKRVKEGAMQRLLSGETRLPGFTGKWVEKKLGECGPFRKGHGITREESHSGSIPAIRYGELYTTHHDIIREYPSRISKDVAKQAVQLKKGDILFACSGETKEEIGKSAAFVDTCEAYAGGDLLILSPGSNFDSAFLGYALNRSSCVLQKAAAGQGDAVVHIREESLKEVIVSLPPTLAEQRAIVAVLSDMDAEIAALSRERAEAERIKQGMMQELLTGKTRLVKGE